MKIAEEQQGLYDDLAMWVVSYQQGDKKTFNKIYKATFPYVAAYVKLHEIPENDREDLIQEIYITVGSNLMTLKEPQACYKWLMRTAANKVVDYFRKNKKRLDMEVFEKEKQEDSVGTDEQLYKQKSTQERAVDEMISVPENILDNKETQKILFTLVNDSLKPMQSEILFLRCYGEKTFKEIAEELNVPESTVKTQFRRSLDKVQKAILKTEKVQGIRLHSVGVIPFVAGLFYVYASAQDASAAEMSAIYAGVQNELGMASGATATGSAIGTGAVSKGTITAGTVAKVTGLSFGKKILAAVICAAVIGGGASAAAYCSQTNPIRAFAETVEEKGDSRRSEEKTPIDTESTEIAAEAVDAAVGEQQGAVVESRPGDAETQGSEVQEPGAVGTDVPAETTLPGETFAPGTSIIAGNNSDTASNTKTEDTSSKNTENTKDSDAADQYKMTVYVYDKSSKKPLQATRIANGENADESTDTSGQAVITGTKSSVQITVTKTGYIAKKINVSPDNYQSKRLEIGLTSIPDGATEYNGHYYKIFESSGTWDAAKKKCEDLGGYLVCITDAKEQQFITGLNSGNSRLWIGGTRDDAFNWRWVSGETWSYENWQPGEPNNSSNVISNENCAAIWDSAGQWNDLNNDNTGEQNGFICEWE